MAPENIPFNSLPLTAIILCINAVFPEGFVYLDQVDPTIVQEVMYYGHQNFVGHQLAGYKAPKVILTEIVSSRSKELQADIKKDNYSLVIYDGYRPSKALLDFIKWHDQPEDCVGCSIIRKILLSISNKKTSI